MPDSTRPPLRGRRGRDRRIAERVAADFAVRHAPTRDDEAVDFDVAAVDAMSRTLAASRTHGSEAPPRGNPPTSIDCGLLRCHRCCSDRVVRDDP